MALTEEKRPYEFLARWDTKTGTLAGAHVGFSNVVLRDGEFVSEAIENVQPVGNNGFPLADIMDMLHITALGKCAEHETTIAALETTITTLTAEIAALKDNPPTAASSPTAAAGI